MDEVCRASYSFTLPQSTSTVPLQEPSLQGFPRAVGGKFHTVELESTSDHTMRFGLF